PLLKDNKNSTYRCSNSRSQRNILHLTLNQIIVLLFSTKRKRNRRLLQTQRLNATTSTSRTLIQIFKYQTRTFGSTRIITGTLLPNKIQTFRNRIRKFTSPDRTTFRT